MAQEGLTCKAAWRLKTGKQAVGMSDCAADRRRVGAVGDVGSKNSGDVLGKRPRQGELVAGV